MKIRYETIYDVLYFEYDWEPAKNLVCRMQPVISRINAMVNRDASKVFIYMLSVHERGSIHANSCAYPSNIDQSVLKRITGMDGDALHDALVDLRVAGMIEGSNPFWGIVNGSYFYKPPRILGDRRRQLGNKIRRLVLAVGKCVHCGKTERLSVDHIRPVALGGGDELTNLQCLCLWCNCSKRDRYIG